MIFQWRKRLGDENFRQILFLTLSGLSLLASLCFSGSRRFDPA